MQTLQSTDRGAEPTAPMRRKWLVLVFIVIAQLMVILDGTIVTIAMPAAQVDLQFGDEDRQWIVTAYSLAFGSLLLLGGRIADLVGQKRAFIIGLAGFALASVLGGIAPSFGFLVGARALQGVFGALLAPAALSLISMIFTDGRERAKAFGIFGAVGASGGAIGMLLGGVLTEYMSWRWCLFVNVMFAVVALVGAASLLPRIVVTARPRLDVLGAITVTVGLVGIVYGFARAETEGWSDALTLASLLVGVALVALFVLVERRAAHPLLPLRVVLDRDRGGALLALVLANIGLFGLFLFLTYYLQSTLGFSALMTGVAFLPFPLAVIISANFVGGMLLPRVGPRVMLTVGALIAAAGLLILQGLSVDGSYLAVVLPALAVMGFGMGLIFTAAISTSTLGVEPGDVGVASAAVNMVQQVGGSIGTALMSTIYGGAVAQYLAGRDQTKGATDAAAVHGYHVIFAVSAVALVAVALVCGLLVRRARDQITPAPEQADAPVVVH